MIKFDTLILFIMNFNDSFFFSIKNCINTLHFSATSQHQFVICTLFFKLETFFLIYSYRRMSILSSNFLFKFLFSLAFLKCQYMSICKPYIFTMLFLFKILEQKQRTIQLFDFVIKVLFSKPKHTNFLHLLKHFIHMM